jgi:prepilin-type processing-associated H-X9-DG protein
MDSGAAVTTWNVLNPGTLGPHPGYSYNLVFADGHVASDSSNAWPNRNTLLQAVHGWQKPYGKTRYPYGP